MAMTSTKTMLGKIPDSWAAHGGDMLPEMLVMAEESCATSLFGGVGADTLDMKTIALRIIAKLRLARLAIVSMLKRSGQAGCRCLLVR